MKKLIKLTESDLHRIVKESVQHIVSEASATPNGFKHRFDPNKRDGDFPLEQPEWTKDPRWQGWQGEDPEWIMRQEKESGDPYYGNKKPVRVSEAQLHQIVKESIQSVLDEAYSDAQYAHLAGQAHGALNSFGGKLKGLFNPKWKSRKERQMRDFASQATRQNSGYEKSSTKGGYNNGGSAYYRMPDHNYTWSNGGQVDYIKNNFNSKNQESPFEMKRNQRYVTLDEPGNIFSASSSRAMANDGKVYSRGEIRDISKQYADKDEWDKYDEMEKLRDSNSMLNRAFKSGQQARKGETHKTFGGEIYTDGTGTSSSAFKRLK